MRPKQSRQKRSAVSDTGNRHSAFSKSRRRQCKKANAIRYVEFSKYLDSLVGLVAYLAS